MGCSKLEEKFDSVSRIETKNQIDLADTVYDVFPNLCSCGQMVETLRIFIKRRMWSGCDVKVAFFLCDWPRA